MKHLKNISYVVLGATLGIAAVYLVQCFFPGSSSKKKPKTNEDKNTKIYVIPLPSEMNKKNNNEENERNQEVSNILISQSNEEPINDETAKAIIDGIALIQDQSKNFLGARTKKSADPISENSNPFNRIIQTENSEVLNSYEKESTVKNTYGQNTSIYIIPTAQSKQTENDNRQRERELVSSLPTQNQNNKELTIDSTQNAVVDGIALIKNHSEEILEIREKNNKSTHPELSLQHKNVTENLVSTIETPDQNSDGEEKKKTIQKTYVKKCGEENVNVVLQYVQTDKDKQLGKDWNLNFKSIESSSKYMDANSHFISIPSEEIVNEKLNSTIYESFKDSTKYAPIKPPRIRKASTNENFNLSKFNKNLSIISSKNPSAQSTLLETNKIIQVKPSDDIKALAEESNIHHSTFQSDNFHIGTRHKSLGSQRTWRRCIYVVRNFVSWKKRANDRSKLLDPLYTPDLIEDDEANFKRYKKLK